MTTIHRARSWAFAAAQTTALAAGLHLLGAGTISATAGEASGTHPLILAQATGPAATPGAGTPPGGFTAEQRKGIEAIIREYLLANPEIMLEVQNAYEAKAEEIQARRTKEALEKDAKEIFRAPSAPVAGNPNGDITVVEFFDYNCGYCKRAFVDIAKLVEKDAKVRIVLKELPILSKGSEEAARVALAAKRQGKYWDVHRALLTTRGSLNEASALAAVDKLGLDMKRLRADMADEETSAEIRRVRDLAQRMGIQGTPHFLVGDRPIAGAPQNLLEIMTNHVAAIRKDGGCKVC